MKIGMTLPTIVEGLGRDDLIRWCERMEEFVARPLGLGPGAAERMDAYVGRYLRENGPEVVAWAQRRVTATSAPAVKDALRRIQDLGADEVVRVPIGESLEELDRLLDVLG